MTRAHLPSEIAATRIIPVLRGLEPERAGAVAAILRSTGIVVVEITMDSPDALTSIGELANAGALVGAGTVLSREEGAAAVAAGASFLVAPHTDLAVVDWAVTEGVAIVPGVLTPTEAVTAWNAGAAAVKIFPASVVGPGLLAAMRAPLPDVVMIPTGGITAAEARSYIDAGAIAVGVGGWLSNHDDLSIVRTRAEALVEVVSTR